MEVYYLDEWIVITLHVAGFLHPAILWYFHHSSDKSALKVTECTIQSAEYWCFYGTTCKCGVSTVILCQCEKPTRFSYIKFCPFLQSPPNNWPKHRPKFWCTYRALTRCLHGHVCPVCRECGFMCFLKNTWKRYLWACEVRTREARGREKAEGIDA